MKNLITFIIGAIFVLPLMSWGNRGVPVPPPRPFTVPPERAFSTVPLRSTPNCQGGCTNSLESILRANAEPRFGQTSVNAANPFVGSSAEPGYARAIQRMNLAIREAPEFMDRALPLVNSAHLRMITGANNPDSLRESNLIVEALAAAGTRAVEGEWSPSDRNAYIDLIRDVRDNGVHNNNRRQLEEVRTHCNIRI